MEGFSISFPPSSEQGCYRLLELPKELMTVVESNIHTNFSIRGGIEDEAVLCTSDRTYALKAVSLSNAFYVLTPPREDEAGDAVIRDTVRQIVELSSSIPRTHRLDGLLRAQLYDDGREAVYEDQAKWKSYSDIRDEIQASDKELDAGLRIKHILVIDGLLRPMAQSYLGNTLESLLNTLVSLSLPQDAVPVLEVIETLQSDHDIPRDVVIQIMDWFGELGDPPNSMTPSSTWKINAPEVVKHIGLGILSRHRDVLILESDFTSQWKTALGDSFEAGADLALLKGNYIRMAGSTLKYFPSSELPIAPQERFADLFLTQRTWNAGDIVPFLDDIAVDSKEREKLLLKYTRSTIGEDGIPKYSAKSAPVV